MHMSAAPTSRPPRRAAQRGNSAFRNRDFETAEALYSAAITRRPRARTASRFAAQQRQRVELGKLADASPTPFRDRARADLDKTFYRKSPTLREERPAAACA